MSDETAYEMLWDCRYCGSKKLLGVTHRHCPSCGAPQDADARYFPADEDRVLAKDHRFAGADVSCPHCTESNGRAAAHCRSCGGPLAGATEVKRRDDVVHDPAAFAGGGPPPKAAPPPKAKPARRGALIGCGTLV
ncbi:MAG: hypothetical protein FJ104_09030, partial [Deltaproteobacteria bacterium]|nr:hypothetical protein [Deltaproteobacteria bacterium]